MKKTIWDMSPEEIKAYWKKAELVWARFILLAVGAALLFLFIAEG